MPGCFQGAEEGGGGGGGEREKEREVGGGEKGVAVSSLRIGHDGCSVSTRVKCLCHSATNCKC